MVKLIRDYYPTFCQEGHINHHAYMDDRIYDRYCCCAAILSNPNAAWLLLFPIVLLGLYFARSWLKLMFALVLGFIWVFGHVLFFQHNTFPAEFEGKEILVEGTIASIPKLTDRSTQFNFKTKFNSKDYLIKLSWYEKLYRPPQAGESWRLLVKLKRPHASMNPGGFDYERNLYRKGISATGYVRRNDVNQPLTDDIGSNLSNTIVKLRQSISNSLRKDLQGKPHQGVIEALAIGDRNRITTKEWDVLIRTGTIHLVAISGLHIGLVAGFAFFLIRALASRLSFILKRMPAQVPAAVVAIVAAFIYALLAGFTIPTQRAFLMVCVVMISLIQRRSVPASNIISFSLLVILLFDPMSVLDVGFWLSFGAVTIILFASIGRLKPPTALISMSKIQFVIAIGMLPLMLLFFQRLSLAAPIANLVAVPLVSFITVPSTLLATITIDILPSLSNGLFFIAVESLKWLWVMIDWLSVQPWAVVDTRVVSTWSLVLAIVGAIYLLMPRGMPARWTALLLFLPALLGNRTDLNQGELNITLIDVGQGLSILLQTQHHSLVFDAGPRYSSSFDAGKNIVIPFLKSQGILEVDTLIVSHGDNDHSGGANAILKNLSVKKVISGANRKRWHNDKAIPCRSGQSWQWDNVHFEILHPQSDKFEGGNNQSCVLQVRVGDRVVLLPADIERATEQLLIKQYGNKLKSHILIAPHHGSKTSSSQAFLEQVAPEMVLISDGYRNRYRFPHSSVIKRYAAKNITWLETQHSGAISVLVTPSRVSEPIRWREKLRRYWHSQ